MGKILELHNVRYRYPGANNDVLGGISTTFQCGKLYCITGKSGSGKSTLLSLMSGLDLCTHGDILCDGISIRSIDRDVYRAHHIGVIFQSYNLLLNATAMENIVLSMHISGSTSKNKQEYAASLLERVGIDSATAQRNILKLSGGQQQRVGIARALSHDPKIILADEPTGNLDPETEQQVMDILKKLAHEDNRCVILVTHSEKVTEYADHVLHLDHGMLIPHDS